MTTSVPLASPLRRVNTPGLYPKSKLASEWERWSTTPNYFSGSEPPLDPVRYYQEFFCLTPNDKVQEEALERLGPEALLGDYNENVSSLFINAVKILKEVTPLQDSGRANIIQTLTVLLKDLLSRDYDNTTQDLVLILVGESSRTDQVFTDFVASLDLIIQDSTFSASLRHSTLRLSLLLVTHLGSSSLVTYFLRRDLFSSLISFISDDSTKPHAHEAVILIGPLAAHRSDGKNPYATRIQDFVEEGIMTRIIGLIASSLLHSRDNYLSIQDDTPPSLVSSLTSMVFSLNKLLYLPNPFAWNHPPPPPAYSPPRLDEKIELLPHAAEKRPDLKGKRRATEEEIAQSHTLEPSTTAPTTPGEAPSPPGSINSFNSSHPSIPPRTPTKSPSQRPLLKRSASSKSLDPFTKMPPQSLAILVSLWEFWKANKTFSSLVFSCEPDQAPILPSTLISLSSYIFSHAFLSPRSRIYSRLTLNLLTLLVDDAGDGKLCYVGDEKEGGEKELKEPQIRMCRQRHPILQNQNVEGKRPMVASLIDSVLLFLRHNLKKNLDVESYIIALRLCQRIMQQLKTEKVELEYEWSSMWRSILTLSNFIVEHVKELRMISDKVDNLISQIFVTLAYAAYWGEQLLASQHEQALLYFELLNSDSTLSSLSDLLGITTLASNLPSPLPAAFDLTASPPQLRGVDPLSPLPRFYFPMPPTTTNNGSVSPTYSVHSVMHYGEGATGAGAGFVATECISNIRSTLTYFQNLIAHHAFSLEYESEDPLEPDEILSIIERNLGGVEMIESNAMGDLPRFSGGREKDREAFERELSDVVREDMKRLLETDFKGLR